MSEYFGTESNGRRSSASFFDWDLTGGTRGACGVTDDQHNAMAAATEALRNAEPGTEARVREVAPGRWQDSAFEEVRIIGRGMHDENSGTVVWRDASQ